MALKKASPYFKKKNPYYYVDKDLANNSNYFLVGRGSKRT